MEPRPEPTRPLPSTPVSSTPALAPKPGEPVAASLGHSEGSGWLEGSDWPRRLEDLADAIRGTALAWSASGSQERNPIAEGAGDVSFDPDVRTEEQISAWFAAAAQAGPLSLLTEETGWRHAGPDPQVGGDPSGGAGWKSLPDWDHGGPRIVIDPIDGTRPWLHGLRSAWTVIGLAPPGQAAPTQRDLVWGLVGEIPLPEAGWVRRLTAARGNGCLRTDLPLYGQTPRPPRPCQARDSRSVEAGFYPFFAFDPRLRAPMADLALRFFERLQAEEQLPLSSAYEDPYIASGGQFALLAMGHYPMLADLRPWIPTPDGSATQCAKPYDVAGAILCAQEAGAVVVTPDGQPWEAPLDASTPVGWVAYAGPLAKQQLHPHFRASVQDRLVER